MSGALESRVSNASGLSSCQSACYKVILLKCFACVCIDLTSGRNLYAHSKMVLNRLLNSSL